MAAEVSRRKIWIAALGAVLLLAALATLNAFNTQLPSPASTQQVVIFTGLSIVAFLLFVAVMILLVRNVLKLYADQHSRVMGTRLRTRMLWGAVLVSLVPIASMFAFSYLLLNRAVDRWFSQPVTEMRDDSTNMALELARYTSSNARAESDSIASGLPEVSAVAVPDKTGAVTSAAATRQPHQSIHASTHSVHAPAPSISRQYRETIYQVLKQHQITLQNGFAVVYHDGRVVASFQMPQRAGATAEVKSWLPDQNAADDVDDAAARVATDPTDAAILTTAQRSDQPV